MASIINAVSGSGITQTADGSGVLKVQSNSVTTNALAWVNFNGTGTVAIRSSYNVSSITDNGTGDYTVNFATALSDANYSLSGMAQLDAGGSDNVATIQVVCISRISAPTTSSARIRIGRPDTAGFNDALIVDVAIFGN
jgi:hypothetical protein